MKFDKILSLFGLAALLVFGACEPIEERQELTNSFDPDEIELEVEQATPGGNKLSIQMNTPGVFGYWDYIIDKKYSDRVEVVFPFTGEHTFTYHVTTPYMPGNEPAEREYVEETVDVQIDTLDEELPAAYYDLVGEELEGKTWVFDGSGGDENLWYFMSPPDDPAAYMSLWWNAGGTCCPPPDVDGKMVFDLEGGANYTYYAGPDADPVHGSFSFNGDYTRITFNDAPVLGNISHEGVQTGTEDGSFPLMEFTEDKMVLYSPNCGYDTGWTFVFTPESE